MNDVSKAFDDVVGVSRGKSQVAPPLDIQRSYTTYVVDAQVLVDFINDFYTPVKPFEFSRGTFRKAVNRKTIHPGKFGEHTPYDIVPVEVSVIVNKGEKLGKNKDANVREWVVSEIPWKNRHGFLQTPKIEWLLRDLVSEGALKPGQYVIADIARSQP